MGNFYTYLIGWSKRHQWYYGVRFSKNCHPSELWKNYFTTSKHVDKFRKDNGEPDVIEIRKIFVDRLKARDWEHKVLRRLHLSDPFGSKSKWLNRCSYPAIINETPYWSSHEFPEEAKKKVSLSLMGNKRALGMKHSDKTKEKFKSRKNAFLGKTHTEETRIKMKAAWLKRNKPNRDEKGRFLNG